MLSSSYCDVFALRLDREQAEEILPGDRVRTGENEFPQFDVVAIHGDKAWVRDPALGGDHIVPLSRCRRA